MGEPLGEALFDLSREAVLIGDTMSGGSSLKRTDVFKLCDGRLLAITSVAERKGEPFSIIDLKVTSSAQAPLKVDTPSTTKVDPSRALINAEGGQGGAAVVLDRKDKVRGS